VLLEILDNPAEKERFRAYVVQHLYLNVEGASKKESETIKEVLGRCLSDRDLSVRREALLALVRLRGPKGTSEAVEWLNGTGPEADAVRDLAIRCVGDLDLKEHVPTIRKFLSAENEVVRRQAIVTLGQMGDEESRPLLEEAAKSDKPLVKSAATAALRRLDAARKPMPSGAP
jgi:HEAT repeat protein